MSRSWTPTLPSKGTTPFASGGAARAVARTRPSLTSPPGLPIRKKKVAFQRTWWFGACLGLVVSFSVVAGGYWFGSRISRRATSSPSTVVASGPSAASSATVVLRATPADASLFLDGDPLLDNPARLTRPQDRRPHVVRATAPNCVSKSVSLFIDGPAVSVDIALDPEPSHASLVTASAPPNVVARRHGTAVLAATSTSAPEPAVRRKPPLDTTDPWQR